MTQKPMMDERMPQGRHADRAALAAQLAGFRRRLSVLAFRRHAPRLIAAAVVVAGAAMLAVHPPIWQAALWLCTAGALGVACAATVAWIRRPSLQATAAVLDRQFRLEDRIVTGLQFSADADPVSGLIVRDAAARLAAHTPMALSGGPPQRLGWLAISGVVLALFAALAAVRTPPVLQSDPPGWPGASSTDAAGGPKPREPGLNPNPARAKAASAVSAARAPIAPAEDVDGGRQRDAAATGPPGAETPLATVTARQVPGPAGQPPGPRGGVEPGPREGAGQRSAVGTARPARSGGEGPGSGAGGGAGSPAGTEAGSGGVKSGMLAAGGRAPVLPPASGPLDSSEYRIARSRAEAAIARQRVPARLRAYIRNYFLAIQPTERR